MCSLLVASLLFGVILYKAPAYTYQAFWSERFRGPLAAALASASVAVGMFVLGFQKSAAHRKTKFWFPLVTSVMVVLVSLFLAEISLRAAVKRDPLGMRLGRIALAPYDWKEFAALNRAFLERTRSKTSFYIEDPVLGWTIGSSRESNDGMYKSSEEGLRSITRGARLASGEAMHRVALFGDSFTFGDDVPFEQSWGHFLELQLGAGAQVLNFGVDGYGIDQTYLRFKNEVANWTPQVSILAFIQDDLYRNVSVYPFFRLSWERPFSKPRFSVTGTKLQLWNVPNIPPDRIFEKSSTRDLPFLEYDGNFDAFWWEQHALYRSYLVRFMATKFPRWSTPNAQTSDDAAVQLGIRLIEEFVEAARNQKTAALVVYLPSRNDFTGAGAVLAKRVREDLGFRNIEVQDMTSCLTDHVPPASLFVEGKPHYSGEGNRALATCLQPVVASYLN